MHPGHVDQLGCAPSWIVEPSFQRLDERRDRTSPFARGACWCGEVATQLADGENRLSEIGGESVGSLADYGPGGPSIGAVEPAEHRPRVREHLVRLANVEHVRDGDDRHERARREPVEQLRFSYHRLRPTRTSRESNPDVYVTALYPPDGIAGARRLQVLE